MVMRLVTERQKVSATFFLVHLSSNVTPEFPLWTTTSAARVYYFISGLVYFLSQLHICVNIKVQAIICQVKM